jgi:hypothetical protein
MNRNHLIAILGTACLGSISTADIIAVEFIEYDVTATDFGGASISVTVQDLYAVSNDAGDVVLNAYEIALPAAAEVAYFQSFTGTGWLPTNLGGPFDTEALRRADSFVTIGGFDQSTDRPEQVEGAGSGSAIDPSFGGNNVDFPVNGQAGWYNSLPPSLNGLVAEMPWLTKGMYGVLIGRFAYAGDFTLEGGSVSFTWNQGIGTPASQDRLTITPAPGALALLGVAGLAGRRRRS